MKARSVGTFVRVTTMVIAVFFIILTIVVSLNVEATPLSQTLLFVKDFETGDLTGFFWNQNEPEVVTHPHPVRTGAYSMRAYLHRHKSHYSYRTGVQLAADPQMPPDRDSDPWEALNDREYWVGVSIYIDPSNVIDPLGESENLFQFKAQPWGAMRHPPFALYMDADNWQLHLRGQNAHDDRWTTPIANDIGRWTDWVFNVKFSHADQGFLRVWKNRELVYQYYGSNIGDAATGVKIAFGVYKWPWRPEHNHPTNSVERLFYFDELRVGNADATYEDVAPPTMWIWLPLVLR